mmetsp:Transcript_19758/g.30482  ORF Transcript_19758/g.30482 Transcript_19758/m.30482 type:complete len:171 (-) Transcript_19758:10-522(-)
MSPPISLLRLRIPIFLKLVKETTIILSLHKARIRILLLKANPLSSRRLLSRSISSSHHKDIHSPHNQYINSLHQDSNPHHQDSSHHHLDNSPHHQDSSLHHLDSSLHHLDSSQASTSTLLSILATNSSRQTKRTPARTNTTTTRPSSSNPSSNPSSRTTTLLPCTITDLK